MFSSAWCLAMAQIQFTLTKKIKIGRLEHLLNPHPPTSDNISFLTYPSSPPPPLKVDVICVSALTFLIFFTAIVQNIEIIIKSDIQSKVYKFEMYFN